MLKCTDQFNISYMKTQVVSKSVILNQEAMMHQAAH